MKQRLELEIPMALPSAGNARHGHWAQRHRVTKQQRETVARALLAHTGLEAHHGLVPADVLLVRVAPDALDDGDNTPASLKGCRDQIADWLGLENDRDPRVRWCYGQAVDDQKRPRYQALRLTIAPRQDCPCCGLPALQSGLEMIEVDADEVAMTIDKQAKAVAAWLETRIPTQGHAVRERVAMLHAADDLDGIKAALKGARE